MTKQEILEFLKRKKYQKYINKLAKKYKNKKIVIYGAGNVFQVISQYYDLSAINIVGIADMKFNMDSDDFLGYKTYGPLEFLSAAEPDLVLIGMLDTEIADSFFKEELFKKFGEFHYEPLVKFDLLDVLKRLFA